MCFQTVYSISQDVAPAEGVPSSTPTAPASECQRGSVPETTQAEPAATDADGTAAAETAPPSVAGDALVVTQAEVNVYTNPAFQE